MYTTRKKKAGLNNCWPLLTETGLDDCKDDLLVFCKISNKIHKKHLDKEIKKIQH